MTQALSVEHTAPAPRHVPDRPPLLAVGVMIWLGSEVMFFSGLFAAYFTIRAHATHVAAAGRRAPRLRPGRHLQRGPPGLEPDVPDRACGPRSAANAARPCSGSS